MSKLKYPLGTKGPPSLMEWNNGLTYREILELSRTQVTLGISAILRISQGTK